VATHKKKINKGKNKRKINRGKNKKKLKTTKKIPDILEYEGYKIGQEIWVKLDIYGGEEWGFGSISQFFPTDTIQPSFDFYDKIRKRFATGAVANIAESPPKRWLNKLSYS